MVDCTPQKGDSPMGKWIEFGNGYIKTMDWKDMALVKCCLCSLGVLVGAGLSPKHKKIWFGVALGVFLATYIPLMMRLVGTLAKWGRE